MPGLDLRDIRIRRDIELKSLTRRRVQGHHHSVPRHHFQRRGGPSGGTEVAHGGECELPVGGATLALHVETP